MKYPIILANPKERAAEREADRDYEDLVLKEWKIVGGEVEFTVEDGWTSFGMWPVGIPASAGMAVRIWGAGLGFPLRGISLLVGEDWLPVVYKTKREIEVESAYWIAENQIRQHEEFEKGKEKLDALYDALPDPLKRRIDRFRSEDSDFRWNGEAYEMVACSEAGRLYKRAMDPEFGKALKAAKIKGPTEEAKKRSSYEWEAKDGTLKWEDTPENRLRAFDAINSKLNGYKYALMETLMPEMDTGHSGNTWAHAMMFALRLVQGQGDLL